MIRCMSRENVDCSVVTPGDARWVFAVAGPSRGKTLSEQTAETLESLRLAVQDLGGVGSIVMLSVFLKNVGDRDACRQIVDGSFGGQAPPTTYIAQSPCDGSLLSIEAWGVGLAGGDTEIQRLGSGTVVVRHAGTDWAYVAGGRDCPGNGSAGRVGAPPAGCSLLSNGRIGNAPGETPAPPSPAGPVFNQSLCAFCRAAEQLRAAGMRPSDVIRTWLYLGDINGPEGATCRYYELNRARTEVYRTQQFGGGRVPRPCRGPVFPASTAIGTAGDELALGCIALRTGRPDVSLVPLENPRQTSSYSYGESYGPESPKFARAMAVVAGEFVTTFISGTASITASETRHRNHVDRQVHETLDNIGGAHISRKLPTPRDLRRRGGPRGPCPGQSLPEAAGRFRRHPGNLPGADGRAADHVRRGRCLPTGTARRNRRDPLQPAGVTITEKRLAGVQRDPSLLDRA